MLSGFLAPVKYGLVLGALIAAPGVCAAAAPTPIAKVSVGAQSGMVLPASGWLWTTDLALGRVVAACGSPTAR